MWHRIKYRLDSQTLGPLDYFLDQFWDHFFWTLFFGPISGSFYRGGGRPLLPREGWDTLYQYSRRGGKQTVVLFFCHANEKLTPKHPTITVVENITNSLFRSSAVESCQSPLSRLVLVLNDTHELSRIIHKLLQLSFCVYSISLLNLSFSSCHLFYPDNRDSGVSDPQPLTQQHTIHKHYSNFNVCTFTIRILLVVLYKTIFSPFSYTVFRLKVPFRTHFPTAHALQLCL